MEILNILYNNNNIAFYLIGAILVIIIIFIVISSMYTKPNDDNKKEILSDPIENEDNARVLEVKENKIEKKELVEKVKESNKIDDIVENLYQKSLDDDEIKQDVQPDLNTFLQEFEVPNNVIEEVVKEPMEISKEDNFMENNTSIEIPLLKEEIKENLEIKDEVSKPVQSSENIENMLKRLYDLRQTENDARKNSLLNEIYDLKKKVDETLKGDNYNYSIDYDEIDTDALADYYLFNEDIEFPKLK